MEPPLFPSIMSETWSPPNLTNALISLFLLGSSTSSSNAESLYLIAFNPPTKTWPQHFEEKLNPTSAGQVTASNCLGMLSIINMLSGLETFSPSDFCSFLNLLYLPDISMSA
eukprot:NODE_254_length_12812_cov_0.286872.p11 type:complete len:112 gc:universal NODE_254_length_12812_cov_0.286872:7621-7956(+)